MKSDQCVIHCRVSTDKQAQQGESLLVQESLCIDIATRNGWTLAHAPWLEAYSGRKTVRPVFNEILQFLDDHPGQVSYYLFRSIDRVTRRGTFAYDTMKRELAARGVAMMDTMGVIQPTTNTLADVGLKYDWSMTSPSEMTEAVMATAAKAEVTTILTRLIGQEIRLTRQGYKIRPPADGYVNQRVMIEGKKRTIQVPDPARAPFIVEMFELRASGHLSDHQIVDRLNAAGFRTKVTQRWDASHQKVIGTQGGRMLDVKRLQEMIKRPIYCGVVWEKWTGWQPIAAAYDGLVSIDIYNAANRGVRFIRRADDGLELLHNYRQTAPMRRLNPQFPFKNVVLCPSCKKPFMGSASRSRNGDRIPAYHCARKHPRIAYSKDNFDQVVRNFIGRLRFLPKVIDVGTAAIYQRYAERHAEVLDNASAVSRTIADLKTEQASLLRSYTEAQSPLMRKVIEQEIENLEAQIDQAGAQRSTVEVTEREVDQYVKQMKRLLADPGMLLDQPTTIARQKALYSLLFDGLPTIEELSSGTAKLSLIAELLEGVDTPEEALVRLSVCYWNQIVQVLRGFANYTTA